MSNLILINVHPHRNWEMTAKKCNFALCISKTDEKQCTSSNSHANFLRAPKWPPRGYLIPWTCQHFPTQTNLPRESAIFLRRLFQTPVLWISNAISIDPSMVEWRIKFWKTTSSGHVYPLPPDWTYILSVI